MKGEILNGVSECWVPRLILALAFTFFSLIVSAIPAYSQSNTPPSFPSAAYLLNSSENPAPFRPVGIPVVATDPDPRDELTYSLEGEDSIFFSIAESSGQLETREPLDYETRSTYLVEVKATDTGGRFDTAIVNINVTNIDEAGKVMLTPIMTNMGPGAHAALTDPDKNLSHVSWQWATSYDQVTWRNIEGAESPSFVPSEEDLRQFLRVRATYSDGHGSGKMAATLFDESVLPGGNHRPEFPYFESGIRSTIAEVPIGGKIGQPLLASDLDRDLLTYWLTGDASLFFEIGADSGQLRTKSALNENFAGRYFGKVHVFDGRGGAVTKAIRIDVGNIPTTATVPATEEEATGTTTPTDLEKETPSTAPGTESGNDQPAQPQSPATRPEPARDIDTAARAETDRAQPVRRDFTEDRTPGSLKASESAEAEQANDEEQEQPLPASVVTKSPPPFPSIEGAATGNVVPPGGNEQNGMAERGILWTIFKWAAWFALCALSIAVVLLLLLKLRRINRREVRLPPPTMGQERRILS